MAAETTRVKDIPTTATTAAADDYVLLDGATNGTRKGLASNLITPDAATTAAHNADPAAHTNLASRARPLVKADVFSPLFAAAGSAVTLAQDCLVVLNGKTFDLTAGTAAQNDQVLAAGQDRAVYWTPDNVLVSSTNFSTPTGYTAAQVLKLGGAHYAPGGNAPAQAGGDSTPQFNPCSAWDLNFRPRCPDPRGMAFVGDGWIDIYLANTTPDLLGTSAYGAAIADGATPPKLPAFWGGNGTTAMGSFSYWSAVQYFAAYGKHLPRYSHLANACYGVTENTSVGTEPTVTALDALRTSRFGLMQATGSMWVWMDEHKDKIHQATLAAGATAAQIEAWINAAKTFGAKMNTESRGQIQTYGDAGHVAGLHGGNWSNGSVSGSRAGTWNNSPNTSNNIFGARGRSDHLILP